MANGLINQQTDLKSLKYSSMPLGSQAPYVTKNIGEAPGGQLGREIQSRIDDTSRIAQMLIDKPGLKYLLNEALLQQTDIQDKIQKARDKGKTLGGALLQQIGNTALNTVKIAASTLAQVPVNGTGTHFLKGFRTDTYLQPTNGNPISGFARFFGAGGVEGAPLALQGRPIEGKVESKFGEETSPNEYKVTAESAYQYDATTGTDEPKNRIISGLDLTQNAERAKKGQKVNVTKNYAKDVADQSTFQFTVSDAEGTSNTPGREAYLPTNSDRPTYGPVIAGDVVRKGEESIPTAQSLEVLRNNVNAGNEIPVSRDGESAYDYTPAIQDFRSGSTSTYSFDYTSPNVIREKRVNLGDQGKKKENGFYTSYSNIDPDAIDKINALDISSKPIDGTDDARDLAKFYFEIITPDGSQFLHFRAFIDNIDDSYNADWQGFNYVGRGEKFYTYGGFERDISVGFKIAAATRSELKPLYRKMVYLASATAPTYGGQGFMRGTLARMTIGSYFSQIPGVITSVKYNLIDDMPWEIAMQNPEGGTDDDVQELPMGLQCSVSFKAIHDFAPVTGLKHYFTNPNPINGAQKFF